MHYTSLSGPQNMNALDYATLTYPHHRINKGNTPDKSFCKSELCFVRYEQLLKRLDTLSRRGKK